MDVFDWIAEIAAWIAYLDFAAVIIGFVVIGRHELADGIRRAIITVHRTVCDAVRELVKRQARHRERRRAMEIMKLQRRQILDAARLQELQNSRK